MHPALPRLLATILALFLLPLQAGAQPGGGEVSVRAVPAAEAVRPGDRIPIAVVLDLADGWHIWPAEHVQLPAAIQELAAGTRTSVTLPQPPAWARLGDVQWPAPHAAEVPNLMGEGTVPAPTYGGRS